MVVFSRIEIDGEKVLNSEGKQLFVPKALCLLSHQPMFSAFAIFLRYPFPSNLTIVNYTAMLSVFPKMS